MKQDTQETIGSRGTVAGFRPLIGEERWLRDEFSLKELEIGWRPLLASETPEMYVDKVGIYNGQVGFLHITKRPLPPPQVETFEAHGHVWYRHVPGDAQPVEDSVKVDILWQVELVRQCYNPAINLASDVDWDTKGRLKEQELIGYRFPDFPAVHTTLQKQQVSVQQAEETDATKSRLLTMYHGWCDVAPDSVAECIADVAKVLYPTDAERCEAEFQKWWNAGGGFFSDRFVARAAYAGRAVWTAAWNAAKQQNP